MAFSDFNAFDRDAFIIEQYGLATGGKTLDTAAFNIYQYTWGAGGVGGPRDVLNDIWLNKADHSSNGDLMATLWQIKAELDVIKAKLGA